MPYFTKKGTGKDKGKTCVYKKDNRTKVGCTAGPVEKYLTALRMAESEDLEWMMGSPKIRLGEIKGEIYDYVSPGDTIYVTGRMFLEEFTFDELSNSLYNEGKFIDLYEEPATVLEKNNNFGDDRLNVKFGENITSNPYWVDIINDDWIDLGGFQMDDDLLITLPNKSINESEDFDWTEGFEWTTDMLYSMLDNCNEIKVSNYSLTTDSPYLMRGEPVIYTLTRCEEWWDKFSQIPLDDNGRGPAEWYQDYDEGRIGLLATYESIHPSVAKYKNLKLVDFEKDGWTITQYPQEIVNPLNGKHTELFILLDDKGKPIYDLIPKEHRERIKTNWEDRFYGEKLNESELSWIEDLEPEFNATMLRYGQKFKNKWGDIIRTIMFIEQDDYEVSYEKPMTGLTFKIVDDPSGYRPYPSHPKDHPLNSELFMNPIVFDEGIKSGQFTPMFTDEEFRLKESDEMDWIRDIEADMLIPGEIYDIKTGNGYYWIPEKFIGKEWDNEYNQEFYKFKDLDGIGGGRKSTQYVKDLMDKGEIRPYDPNWSVRDEITFTNNIEDALNGSFAIYFKDGVYLDQTKELQDRLFDMGFSFYTKGPNQYITSEDSPKKIQFFECINWDTSNDRYRNMPPNQWDNKKVMLVSVDGDSLSRWTRRGDDKRLEDQKLFLNIVDNNAIVINGDGYVNNDLNESEDFDWFDLQSDRPLHNVTFKVKWYPETLYTIKDDGLRSSVKIVWINDFGEKQTSTYMRDTVNKYFKKGTWEPFEGTITESSDLDWIQKQEPEKVMKKSKSYVIDVRHLKSEPPNSPLSPRYNDLTKEDILDKLRNLGYNVSDIDVDSATYFYVEPNPDTGYWDDVVWIKQTHWVDYDTTEKDDPTFGGKYEMIDVDEFMFLIDNNLISESDFDWLDMGEPMSICEVQHKLNVGDTIIIDKLLYWEDSSSDEEKVSVENGTATVLAIDACNRIQPNNSSTDKTILIHVNEEYTGFDEYWVRDFKPEYQKPCMDGRCMYLICGESDEMDEIKITKLPSKIFGENKKPINEVAGISFEARKWAEIIYNEIISNPEEKTRLIIDGYDHPEAFDGFPIDYVVIDFYDRLTGYGQEHSGYDKDGNYVVLLYVQPKLVSGQGGYSLQSALNHEMKHAWEDYNRLSKGLPSIEQTKESQQLYNRDYILMLSDQNVRGPIKEILKYYYYLSNLEKSAYLENVYDQNPAYERVVRDIASKDFESFKDRFDLDVNWHLMNTAYDIPFLKKFKSPREFIDYSAEELRSRALKMIKKMNKMKYIHGKY